MFRLFGAGPFGLVQNRFPRLIKTPVGIAVVVAFLMTLAGFIAVTESAMMWQELADMPVDWDMAGNR